MKPDTVNGRVRLLFELERRWGIVELSEGRYLATGLDGRRGNVVLDFLTQIFQVLEGEGRTEVLFFGGTKETGMLSFEVRVVAK